MEAKSFAHELMSNPFARNPPPRDCVLPAPPAPGPFSAHDTTLTVVMAEGQRQVASATATAATAPGQWTQQQAAAPGDATEPNNWYPLDQANAFSCAVGIKLGCMAADGKAETKSVAPDQVSLTVVVTAERAIVWDVEVVVTNTMGSTAAVVLSVPRLPDLLLLEERHTAAGVVYEPIVQEKEKADEAYRQAAASSTHSATLSDTQEDAFAIKLDKLAAGTTARFSAKFLQACGLKGSTAVVPTADAPSARLADLAILPGFTSLTTAGVPFSFTLVADAAFAVVLPPDAVLMEDVSRCSNSADAGRWAKGDRVTSW